MKPILRRQLNCRKIALTLITALLFHSVLISQTKFYLNLNTASPLTPAYNAGWTVTTGATRYLMSTVKDASTITSKTTASVTGVGTGKVLLDQWVSEPLAAQTIAAGTFTGQIRFNISSVTNTTGQGFVYIRIINTNGTIASETANATTTNLTATLTNRTLISVATPLITITAGQRIAVEIGWNYNITSGSSRT